LLKNPIDYRKVGYYFEYAIQNGVEELAEREGAMLWPLVVYFVAIVTLAVSMIVISHFLGERHKERVTGEPYESGIAGTDSARLRFSVKFYLIAMFFVIFDVASIFVFAWALTCRQVGWAGYIAVLVLMGVLASALVYLWRLGALDWTTRAGSELYRAGNGNHTHD
jgi:NADH-quinone oxidoreductase subunit A